MEETTTAETAAPPGMMAPESPSSLPATAPSPSGTRAAARAWWALRFALALFLFIGALQLMKTGAGQLAILEPGGLLVRNPITTLGAGWLGALLVLSGSPIAAVSLALVAAGEVSGVAGHFTEIQGFTMLTGSRLGAAFVVLLTAVVFALRGKEGERKAPLSTAVMALCTTAVIYIPAAIMGLALLNWGPFHSLDLQFPGQFNDLIDVVYGGMLDRAETLPAGLVFLGGLGVLLVSFKVLDSVMPDLQDGSLTQSRLSWMTGKWTMFGLGCLVALITMSVSVALTILVPLVAKGYAKRENIIPYIMGANITTLGDTLLAGFALDSAAAARIVLAQVICTTLLSVILLTFFYPQVRRGIWRFQRQMVRSKPRLAAFTAALFVTPVMLILIAGSIG